MFSESLRLNRGDATVWFNLGFAEEKRGKLETAINAFSEAVKLRPTLDRAWYGMGMRSPPSWSARATHVGRSCCVTPSTTTRTPVAAAEVANAAGARLLVYSHVIPPLPNALAERVFLRGVDAGRPRGTVVGYDGLRVTLPVGCTEIRITDLN